MYAVGVSNYLSDALCLMDLFVILADMAALLVVLMWTAADSAASGTMEGIKIVRMLRIFRFMRLLRLRHLLEGMNMAQSDRSRGQYQYEARFRGAVRSPIPASGTLGPKSNAPLQGLEPGGGDSFLILYALSVPCFVFTLLFHL